MGTKGNKNLEEQLIARYSEGMIDFYIHPSEYENFEALFNHFNACIYPYLGKKEYQTLVEETNFLIKMTKFRTVKNKYLEVYE
jgi:hypothetical protein